MARCKPIFDVNAFGLKQIHSDSVEMFLANSNSNNDENMMDKENDECQETEGWKYIFCQFNY